MGKKMDADRSKIKIQNSFDGIPLSDTTFIENSDTESPLKRMLGTFKMDLQTIHGIKDEPNLRLEGRIILLLSLTVLSAVQLVSIFNIPDNYEVESAPGSVFRVLIDRYIGTLLFIFLLAWISRNVTLHTEIVDTDKLIKMLSYVYVLFAASAVILFIGESTNILLIQYIWGIIYVYALIVYFFVFTQATERSYYQAARSVVYSLIGSLAFQYILGRFVDMLFGGSYQK